MDVIKTDLGMSGKGVEISLDDSETKMMYHLLLQVGRDAAYSNQSRILAFKLSDVMNKIHM